VSGEAGRYGGSFQGGSAQIYLVPALTSGSPKGGFHNMGELFMDANGDLFLYKKGGTPGTWVKVA
jgi:hypothetical protein